MQRYTWLKCWVRHTHNTRIRVPCWGLISKKFLMHYIILTHYLTFPLLLPLLQGYFQRILSIKSTSVATTLSIVSMFGCLILAVPSAVIGVVARATDWSLVPGYNRTFSTDDGNAALPMVLRYLTPQWVSFVGRSSYILKFFIIR